MSVERFLANLPPGTNPAPTRADLTRLLRDHPRRVLDALGVGLIPVSVPIDGPPRLHVTVPPGRGAAVPVAVTLVDGDRAWVVAVEVEEGGAPRRL